MKVGLTVFSQGLPSHLTILHIYAHIDVHRICLLLHRWTQQEAWSVEHGAFRRKLSGYTLKAELATAPSSLGLVVTISGRAMLLPYS